MESSREEGFVGRVHAFPIDRRPSMQMVKPSQVPRYLRSSAFFLGLNTTDDEEFSIPVNHMKSDYQVNSLEDAVQLLNSLRFWGSDVFPLTMVRFLLVQKQNVQDARPKLRPYRDTFPYITFLLNILEEEEPEKKLEIAMAWGTWDVVRHLYSDAPKGFSNRALFKAAKEGHLECLEYALNRRGKFSDCTRDNSVYAGAVEYGRLECLQLLHHHHFNLLRDTDGRDDSAKLTQLAAQCGHLACLQFLCAQGCSMQHTVTAAAAGGHVPCLQYALLHSNVNVTYNACVMAAQGKHIACLQYLVQHNYPCDVNRVASIAASKNCLPILEYMQTLGCSVSAVSTRIALLAAQQGNLTLLQKNIKLGARVTVQLVAAAAQFGHLQCLQYLYTHCTERAVKAQAGGKDWLTYLYTLYGGTVQPSAVTCLAAEAAHWACVAFLITHQAPLSRTLTTILIQHNQLALFHQAVAQGCCVSLRAACFFAASGNLANLTLSMTQGQCVKSPKVVVAAARGGAHGMHGLCAAARLSR